MRVKLVALWTALVILALLTLLWSVLIFRDQGMDWDWGISILVAWWMTLVIAAGGTAFAAGRLRVPMGLAMLCSVVIIGFLFSGVDGDWPLVWGLWFGAVGIVQIGLLSLLDLRASRPARVVRAITFISAGLLAASMFAGTADLIDLEPPVEEWHQKSVVYICLLNAMGTIAVYLLAAMQSLQRPAAESLPSSASLAAACPRCGSPNTFASGRSECGSCGLRVTLEIEEPRCACGYLLYKLDSAKCPECGRQIRRATPAVARV